MPTTQSAYDWLRSRAVPEAVRREVAPELVPEPVGERGGHAEVDRLRTQIEDLVGAVPAGAQPREAVDSALGAVARMQVVTANLDACKPPVGERLAKALVELADRRLRGHADAIERGMTYTGDNTMRKLRNET